MLISPFQKISQNRQKRNLVFLFIFMFLMVAIMRFFDSELKNEVSPNGIVSFELAKELPKSIAILNAWGDSATSFAHLSLKFDFLFLVLYSFFLALLIHRLNEISWKEGTIYQIGELICWSMFVAALFDVIENLALIQLLKGNLNQLWSSIAYYFAFIKFALLALGIVFILLSFGKRIFTKILK